MLRYADQIEPGDDIFGSTVVEIRRGPITAFNPSHPHRVALQRFTFSVFTLANGLETLPMRSTDKIHVHNAAQVA